AGELRQATIEPPYNPRAVPPAPDLDPFLAAHADPDSEAVARIAREAAMVGAAAAPTLVRHTQPSAYPTATYAAARDTVASLLDASEPDGGRGVELSGITEPPLELAATLAYRVSPLSYRQILAQLTCRSDANVEALADIAFASRGPHDDPVRETRTGYQLIFDLCLDNGAFRDLHRHRNCIQIIKDFTPSYGYDTPAAIGQAGQETAYRSAMDESAELAERMEEQAPGLGQYALPLAFRRRALFKMDAAELGYIVETRTKPAGHFSYRE